MGSTVAYIDVSLPQLPQPNDIAWQHLRVSRGAFAGVDYVIEPTTFVVEQICVPCGVEITIELRYADHADNRSEARVMKFTIGDTVAPPMPAEFTVSAPVFEVVNDVVPPTDPAVDPNEPAIVADGDESGEAGTDTPPEVIE
jgi:hypothetical protein